MKRLNLSGIPTNPDLGLLLLRVSFACLMIIFHGWEKLMTAPRQFHSFPNLIGISSELSYVLVAWLENFGALLIALGFYTNQRFWACLHYVCSVVVLAPYEIYRRECG